MLEAIAACRAYVRELTQQQQLGTNPQTLHAIAWNLMILGEAARHVPNETAIAYPEIPWAQIRGLRNHIVHGYDQIDLEIVWNVVNVELPPLVSHSNGCCGKSRNSLIVPLRGFRAFGRSSRSDLIQFWLQSSL